MAKVDVYNMDGAVTGQIELSDAIFGIEPNVAVVQQVVKAQLANLRQGTSSTKTRSEVRGGGRKPYRQKGTGRARQGSIRAAQWVGGGVIFGPKPRDYSQKVPKKIGRLALKSVLSQKVVDQKLIVVEDLKMDVIKTKQFVQVLKNLKLTNGKTYIVTEGGLANVERSARNVVGVHTGLVNTINTLNLVKYDNLVVTKAALSKIEEVYA